MVLIGQLSYSIYLLHLLALTPGEVYFRSHFQTVISGLLLTGVVAYILFIFVERPIAGLRRHFKAKQHPSPLTTVVPLTPAPSTGTPQPTMS
jgi:peptidoglycan/LPS O-acetylase OafA/YrhL